MLKHIKNSLSERCICARIGKTYSSTNVLIWVFLRDQLSYLPFLYMISQKLLFFFNGTISICYFYFRLNEDNVSSRKSRHNCILSVFLVHKLNPWFCTYPRLSNIETADLQKIIKCNRQDTKPHGICRNRKLSFVYRIAISSIRYWFKLSKMPMTRFPKQALIMLKNSMDANTTIVVHNIAWNHNYGFHDVWTNGRVENGKVFFPRQI